MGIRIDEVRNSAHPASIIVRLERDVVAWMGTIIAVMQRIITPARLGSLLRHGNRKGT